MTSKKYYLTTPLYYVNAKPHIGHAYTNVLCDTFARFQKFLGRDVFLLTGTDEHGTKIEKIARGKNQTPKSYADSIVPEFEKLWKTMDIQYDFFFRTTSEDHKKAVHQILTDLEKKGDVYKSSYEGWYCVPCESFWKDLQLVEAKCPDCHREVQRLSEENYFFKLRQHQEWLIDTIQKNPDWIRPERRRNEILSFLKEPLDDLCITRPRSRLSWGIDYPGSADHVVYVWFDALINYVSAAGYPFDLEKMKTLWPADFHMVGKDILRQHTVYWPIMLKAMGLAMPKAIVAHGWWTLSGAKVSKSAGNAVEPLVLIDSYGADAFRYFLLHEVTLGMDGAFSEDLLRERYTTQLANDLGNLWFRYASMLDRYFGGCVPAAHTERIISSELYQHAVRLYSIVAEAMSGFDPRLALDMIFEVVTCANQFVENQKPWTLAKDPARKPELELTLAVLGESIAHVACILQPLLPVTAKAMLDRLGLSFPMTMKSLTPFQQCFLVPGFKVQRGNPLFPKLDDLQPQAG